MTFAANASHPETARPLDLFGVLPAAAAWLPVVLGLTWKHDLWWAALFAPCAAAWGTCTSRVWMRSPGFLSWGAAWLWMARGLESGQVLGGLGALFALMVLGALLGSLVDSQAGQRLRGTGALCVLALCLFLTGIPAGFWLFLDPPWSPPVAAFLLDCSPAAFLMESAGVDFLRQPANYGPVGADSLDPNLRMAWGNLAGWGVCVVGLGLSMAKFAWRSRKRVPQRKS